MSKFQTFFVFFILIASYGMAYHPWCTTDVCTQVDAHFVYVASAGEFRAPIYSIDPSDQAYKAKELCLWLGTSPLDPKAYEKGQVSKIFRFETKMAAVPKREPFPFLVIGVFMCVAFGTLGIIALRKRG